MSEGYKLIEFRCDLCGGQFEMNSRRARDPKYATQPLCSVCRILARLERRAEIPDEALYYSWWLNRLPGSGLEELLSEIFGPRAMTAAARSRRARLIEAASASGLGAAA